jgi:phenol hydroxylase P3 protein
MSGAAHNGDMATVTFGFSAQSDEARHMTLGLEVIKFLLEQHEDNVPIVQKWIDKWFWRGTRLLTIVAMMMDYMLPNKVMSWKEAWEVYFEEAGGSLFKDLARYGIKMPKYAETIEKEKEHVSHQAWWIFYTHGHAAGFHTWIPSDEELDWLSEKYPDTFDKYYRPRWELAKEMEAKGERFYTKALPQLCTTCQIPMGFTEMDDPTQVCYRDSVYKGDRYHFCSDGCKDIFDDEPEKYVQSWLPVHQIFQGNCGGPDVENVLSDFYRMNLGEDNMDMKGSPDEKRWKQWKGVA